MSRVENIENQIKELSQEELTALRQWFADFDGDAWDRQMEADINAGRLDTLAERALRDHEAGRSTKLRITMHPRTFGPATENCPHPYESVLTRLSRY